MGLKLAHLLISKGRLNMVNDIADEYRRRLACHQGLETAEVTTAVALNDTEKQHLAERLNAITGKEISLEVNVNPAIIGGIKARIDDRLLDGSTKSRLEALKKEIASGR
jgi:F-type H+-transporting ATPase subunit delta